MKLRYVWLALFFASLIFNKTINAFFEHNSCDGVYFAADYLAWKAQEDQLQYGLLIPGGTPQGDVNNFFLRPRIINQCFNFDSGVKLALGYNWCDEWDTWIDWTHFHQTSCSGVVADAPTALIATLLSDPGISGAFINFTSKAQSQWKLHYDFISVALGRYISLCENSTIETYLGIAGARIHQQQAIIYNDVTDGGSTPENVTLMRCNNFGGGGLQAGVDVNWLLGCTLSLVGKAYAALLLGKFNAINTTYFATTNRTLNLLSCAHRVRPLFDVSLGLRWSPEICSCSLFGINLAFETVYAPNQWQVPASLLSTSGGTLPGGGDLAMYGITIGIDMVF